MCTELHRPVDIQHERTGAFFEELTSNVQVTVSSRPTNQEISLGAPLLVYSILPHYC